MNYSGDSDSTGSITGQILGALLGVQAIPGRWLGKVELRDEIEQLASELHGLSFYVRGSEIPNVFMDRYPGN